MGDTTMNTSNGRMVSFLFEGDETVSCEVCLEPFQATSRPPKILPCGHNFCEQCLFSICCHQEYYLLDSINCPTCRRSFSTNTAKAAPTNYDLCKILENVQRGRELNNVTVIHVPGTEGGREHDCSQSQRSTRRGRHTGAGISDECRRLAESTPVVKAKSRRCIDCQRKIGSKNLAKFARFCEDCTRSGHVHFSCLECCVNRHNGHKIYSISQLETAQLQVISELRDIRLKTLDASEQFDRRLNEIQRSGQQVDCPSVVANKQNSLSEALMSIDEATDRLESPKLHSLTFLKNVKDAQLSHYMKVGKMNNLLEKCVNMTNTESSHRPKQGMGRLPSFSSTSQLRQSKLTVRGDDALAKESIATLASVLPRDENVMRLEQALQSITPRDTIEHRKGVYLTCASVLTRILYDDVSLPAVFMFADAFLNCYYQMHVLSRKKNDFGKEPKKITRSDIWKNIQFAYTELLRVAAKQFPSYHPERVDVIDDLAYLCHLYADVCDQASVTICMIEAARARAAEGMLSESDRELTQQRLQLIDEHLLECRRMQKLQELRTTKTKRESRGGLKRLFTSCMRPRVAA